MEPSKPKNYHTGHRQRLKARFLQEGLSSFAEHEVLELLLFYALPQRDTNTIAHQLIDTYGSLAQVLDADPTDLAKQPGLGEHSATLLTLIPELTHFYLLQSKGQDISLNNANSASDYVQSLFVGLHREVFYVVCLDAQCRVRHAGKLQSGSMSEVSIYPRDVVELALRHKAVSVILAHNHPGGTARPSKSDVRVTGVLMNALLPMGIEVLDHIVVADDGYFSFARDTSALLREDSEYALNSQQEEETQEADSDNVVHIGDPEQKGQNMERFGALDAAQPEAGYNDDYQSDEENLRLCSTGDAILDQLLVLDEDD